MSSAGPAWRIASASSGADPRELVNDQPQNDSVFYQSYVHVFARIFVRPLLGTWVRPNHLTGLRLLTGLAACALLAVGSRNTAVWSGILWVVSCVLDRADGELARMGNLRSNSGKVLDFYSDLILDSFWFLGAGIGLRHSSLGEYATPLGILACGSMLLVMWSSELLERLSAPGVKAFDFKGVKRFHPDDLLFLLAPFTWLGWLVPILVASSVCTPIFAIVITVRYFMLKRRIAVT
jgi:archaetidylinositol phosphate synthase